MEFTNDKERDLFIRCEQAWRDAPTTPAGIASQCALIYRAAVAEMNRLLAVCQSTQFAAIGNGATGAIPSAVGGGPESVPAEGSRWNSLKTDTHFLIKDCHIFEVYDGNEAIGSERVGDLDLAKQFISDGHWYPCDKNGDRISVASEFNEAKCRKDFEEWVIKYRGSDYKFNRLESGPYLNSAIERYWVVWLAAAQKYSGTK